VPLAILEIVFQVRKRAQALPRLVVATVLGLASAATLVGIAAATLLMWLPHMQ
jgi:hypothetical protein